MKQENPEGFLILSDDRLDALGLSSQDILDAIVDAVRAQARGEIWTAPKSAVLPGDGRYMMTTLSTGDRPQITVVKSVMVSPRNPARGMPGVEGAILVQDSETGALLAIMQAGWITAVRTAGLSAAAARKLANPKARKIAFIGSGVQARSHLDAFSALFPLTEMNVFGRGQANIDALCQLACQKAITATQCTTPREAIVDADLIVTSITLSFDLEPFLDARWVKQGSFAAIIDAGVPWQRDGMAAFETIFIDDLTQERDSPKKMVDMDLVAGDLPDLIGDDNLSIFNATKRCAFIFRGLAIGDFAIAGLAYARASEAEQVETGHW